MVETEVKRNKKIWVFNAGDAFSGNPKWLFLYIVNHRKDITPYWLCYKENMVSYMKERGYKAYLFNSSEGKVIERQAGIYVVNQVKEVIQDELKGVTILNLWHGVGCKSIERKVNFGFLNERIAKKYIKNNYYYKNYQLFLVTSPLMENHFKEQCGIDDDKVIRAGYPCCIHNEAANSFDHDVLKRQGLPENTKIVVYSPTYRDASATEFFGKAIQDMDRLVEVLEKNGMLLIFKMHPQMMKDRKYNEAMERYKACNRLMFWDNQDDIYEVFDQIDIAIIDYSSIFYDMLAGGVKHFIRYMFDIDDKNNLRDFVFDVKEMTCGYDCNNFDELLDALDHSDVCLQEDEDRKREIYDLFWEYAKSAGNEEIVEAALDFEPNPVDLPNVYSFDIFDTLIKRKALKPASVFYYVQDMLAQDEIRFPNLLLNDYARIRMQCEANVREWYKKTLFMREGDRLEITLDEIYERMQNVYLLSDEQIARMKELEQQTEIEQCIPYPEHIDVLKQHLANGEKVLLISDMYLPKETIIKMLEKADPILTTVPLYLSSEYGVQKTIKKLFLEAYKDMDYIYGEWIHYGDSPVADCKKPSELGIATINHTVPALNEYEQLLVDQLQSYDAYLAAAAMARYREEYKDEIEDEEGPKIFAYAYASLYFVPYINWAIKDAVRRGTKCLYFISRDGYHLKRIADALIEVKGYPIKTKYIYGSRKAWRIPSFVNEIDDEFFSEFGNFANIKKYDSLLKAMDITEEDFIRIFPELEYLKSSGRISKGLLKQLRLKFSESDEYRHYIIEKAAEERKLVRAYLQQEINFNESFAFVEYWGRGYTQDCLTRLLDDAAGHEVPDPCYYARSIYGTDGRSIRYNYTTNTGSLIFIEALFANLDYRSVPGYVEKNGRIEPIILPCDNDMVMQKAFEENFVRFAKDFYGQPLQDEDRFEREIFNFAMDYYRDYADTPIMVKNIAHLKDSVEQYGAAAEFAPQITFGRVVGRFFKKDYFYTKSRKMSLARSNPIYQKGYIWYKDTFKKTNTFKNIRKLMKKRK